MWYVDGVSTTNLINGTSAQGVNYDFVEEVNFKSSGYNAEYGGSLGGVVNVLTRSGGNEFHGDVLAYYNDEALTARRRDVLQYNKFDLTPRPDGPVLRLGQVRRQTKVVQPRGRVRPGRLYSEGPALVLRLGHAQLQ